MLGLVFSLFMVAEGESAPPSVATFRTELGIYLDLAATAQKDLKNPKVDPQKNLEALFTEATSLATIYIAADHESRLEMEKILGASIRSNKELKNFWLPLGNAFMSKAKDLIQARKAKARKLKIASGTIGLVVGYLVGKSLLFRFVPRSTPEKAYLYLTGTAAGGAALGYFLIGSITERIFLPVDPLVAEAKDFQLRFESGEDFLEEVAAEKLLLDSLAED